MRWPERLSCELPPEAVARILWLRRRLLPWFTREGRTFPWRVPGTTPYEVVVAEILLQRTTASAVARAYKAFVERYPSWAALAQAPLEDLENALRPLGLWRQKVLAVVYGQAEPLLDANMARLLGRFLGSSVSAGASPKRRLHALALRLVRSKRSLEVNWAALDFGALVCRARRPLCHACPLRSRCEYARELQSPPTSISGVL